MRPQLGYARCAGRERHALKARRQQARYAQADIATTDDQNTLSAKAGGQRAKGIKV